MATSIHHGPPGSFKSFSLVQRFAIPALKAGRCVVCNIRGFDSLERIIEQFPDVVFPETARLIYLETTTRESRMIMAGWFHWVPIGALIIIDEGQEIYPDRRDFKLESLDAFVCPDGFQPDEIEEGRPIDVFTAYDKQRHYQWDIFISTTNVAKIKSEIRQVTEWAYRHRNLTGLFPWLKNQWVEHQHDPENNGKAESHRVGSPIRYKADARIFRCYKSTATGSVTESQAGQSILKNPALLFPLLLFVACFLIILFILLSPSTDEPVESSKDIPAPQSIDKNPAVPVKVAEKNSSKAVSQHVNHVSNVKTVTSGIGGYDLVSIAYNDLSDFTKLKFNYIVNNVIKTVNVDYFLKSGFKIVSRGLCAIDLVSSDKSVFSVYCQNPVISACSVVAQSDTTVSYRGCSLVASESSNHQSNKSLDFVSAAKDAF